MPVCYLIVYILRYNKARGGSFEAVLAKLLWEIILANYMALNLSIWIRFGSILSLFLLFFYLNIYCLWRKTFYGLYLNLAYTNNSTLLLFTKYVCISLFIIYYLFFMLLGACKGEIYLFLVAFLRSWLWGYGISLFFMGILSRNRPSLWLA